IRSVSSNPRVVINPTLEPARVRTILSTTVDPCTNSLVWASRSCSERSIVCAAERIESRTPSAKFGGVDSALPRRIGSPAANTTVSVQVPPTSAGTMDLRLPSAIDAPRRLGRRSQCRDAEDGCALGERVRPRGRRFVGNVHGVIGGKPLLAAGAEQQGHPSLHYISKHRNRGWPLGLLELAFGGDREDRPPHARLAQQPQRSSAFACALKQFAPHVPKRIVGLHRRRDQPVDWLAQSFGNRQHVEQAGTAVPRL